MRMEEYTYSQYYKYIHTSIHIKGISWKQTIPQLIRKKKSSTCTLTAATSYHFSHYCQKRKAMFDEKGQLYNGIHLSFRKGFGFTQNTQMNTAICLDDNRMVYLLAKQVLLYDALTETQKVVDSIHEHQEITFFSVFKNILLDTSLLYATFNTLASNKPSVIMKTINNRESKIVYTFSNLEKQDKIKKILLMKDNKQIWVFSENSQHLFTITIMQMHNKKIICSEDLSNLNLLNVSLKGMVEINGQSQCILLYDDSQIYLVSCSPADELKKCQQNNMKLTLVKMNMKRILELNEQIVQVISSISTPLTIYLISNFGFLYELQLPETPQPTIKIKSKLNLGVFDTVDHLGEIISRNKIPSCICCDQYNILIGYQLVEELTLVKTCAIGNPQLIQQISFSCPYLHQIKYMAFASESNTVSISVQLKQQDKYGITMVNQSQYLKEKGEIARIKQNPMLHRLAAGRIIPVMFNLLLHDTLIENVRSPMNQILSQMQFDSTLKDICLIPTKRLMLILSHKKIKAVKYDNLQSASFQRMVSWQMNFNSDDLLSVDVHPLTLEVAVGFRDGLKMFMLSSQGLIFSNTQFPFKNCECVRYSQYGHKLLVGSNSSIIIINPYTNKITNTINLSSTNLIKQLHVLNKDMFIHACFGQGSVVMADNGSKLVEIHNQSNLQILCSAYDSYFDVMAVSYQNNSVKLYGDRGTREMTSLWMYPHQVTAILIVLEIGTIFMGNSAGQIRAYQWPITDSIHFNKSYTQVHHHQTNIKKLQITHDYAILVSTSADGIIYLDSVNAVVDGIKTSKNESFSVYTLQSKTHKQLFYLQKYLRNNPTLQNDQDEVLAQMESDQADFQSQYQQLIQTAKEQQYQHLKQVEEQQKCIFKAQLLPFDNQIQKLNLQRIKSKSEFNSFMKETKQQAANLEELKLNKLRQLYKETDILNEEKQKQINYFKEELQKQKNKLEKIHQLYISKLERQQKKQQMECIKCHSQNQQSLVLYEQLLKEQGEEDQIERSRVKISLEKELIQINQLGEVLRSQYNKLKHSKSQEQHKIKYFNQMSSDLTIDIAADQEKNISLKSHQIKLNQLLQEKDQQIYNSEQTLKIVLNSNILNHLHDSFLVNQKDTLAKKQEYLENEIVSMNERCIKFETDFTDVVEAKTQINSKIQKAKNHLNKIKINYEKLKSLAYLGRYQCKEFQNKVYQTYSHSVMVKKETLQKQLQELIISLNQNHPTEQGNQIKVDTRIVSKKQLTIKQINSLNNFTQIEERSRNLIQIRLNKENVNLTSEINELRKNKNKLSKRLQQLQENLKEVGLPAKENISISSVFDIKNSNQTNNLSLLLPFEQFNARKIKNQAGSYILAKKALGKSINQDENASKQTKLPSLFTSSFMDSSCSCIVFGASSVNTHQ